MTGIIIKDATGTAISTSTTPAADGGQTRSVNVEGTKATYSAATGAVSPTAASATDVFVISGSATKTVRVTRISMAGTQTTAGAVAVNLIKRSTLDTAGTAVTATNVAHDSTMAAGTAVVKHYTANPSGVGTIVGNVRSKQLYLPTATSAAPSQGETLFGDKNDQTIVLRGVNECLAINLAAGSPTGISASFEVEWTEE